ncbi:hypothetical protein NEDG_01587 [Nematocida displodere]|uniref:Uncharacterized protein n=1 Tax=Nematocida displodere TaxID=1805483 RepID=A0A177EGS8_9MICR|nr:hypothetical protein NEDG_01587 [Nematocida displodere]
MGDIVGHMQHTVKKRVSLASGSFLLLWILQRCLVYSCTDQVDLENVPLSKLLPKSSTENPYPAFPKTKTSLIGLIHQMAEKAREKDTCWNKSYIYLSECTQENMQNTIVGERRFKHFIIYPRDSSYQHKIVSSVLIYLHTLINHHTVDDVSTELLEQQKEKILALFQKEVGILNQTSQWRMCEAGLEDLAAHLTNIARTLKHDPSTDFSWYTIFSGAAGACTAVKEEILARESATHQVGVLVDIFQRIKTWRIDSLSICALSFNTETTTAQTLQTKAKNLTKNKVAWKSLSLEGVSAEVMGCVFGFFFFDALFSLSIYNTALQSLSTLEYLDTPSIEHVSLFRIGRGESTGLGEQQSPVGVAPLARLLARAKTTIGLPFWLVFQVLEKHHLCLSQTLAQIYLRDLSKTELHHEFRAPRMLHFCQKNGFAEIKLIFMWEEEISLAEVMLIHQTARANGLGLSNLSIYCTNSEEVRKLIRQTKDTSIYSRLKKLSINTL